MLCSDDIIKIEDFDLGNNLLDEKSYENTLIYDVSYKTLIGPKPLRIRFDKIDEFIRVYNGTTYLVLFVPEKYAAIYNRGKVDFYDLLPIDEILTLHNTH